jgi:ribonuclease D
VRAEQGQTTSLEEVCARAREVGSIALDTEFMSERRYWPLLCVVALAVESNGGAEIAVVDALAAHDPAPAVTLLRNPAVEVVLHAGMQDVALLRRVWKAEVTRAFDTQIAAAFVGATVNSSYGKLINEFLGVRLDKESGFTRWDRRPLSADQLAYARHDVEHLPALARLLRSRLRDAGRLEWAREESRVVESASDGRDPHAAFRRLPAANRLSATGRAVARELATWREVTAQAVDRPVRTVLNDAALVQVARERPQTVAELRHIRGVDGGFARRYGDEVVAAIRAGEQAPPPPAERAERQPDEVEALTSLGEALLRSHALEEGIAPQLIAARGDLAKVATAVLRGAPEPPVPVLSGWRREMVGLELLELLRGEVSLRVDARGRIRARKGAR